MYYLVCRHFSISNPALFSNNLYLRDAGDGKTFFVDQAFEYHLNTLTFVRVTAQFRTDLASIPRIARVFIPKLGKFNQAAVVHDYLYKNQFLYKEEYINGRYVEITRHVSRSEADKIFLSAMKTAGVSWTKRRSIYLAVRAGGWAYWKECKGC